VTFKCKCPIASPQSFGADSCAHNGTAAHMAAKLRVKISLLINHSFLIFDGPPCPLSSLELEFSILPFLFSGKQYDRLLYQAISVLPLSLQNENVRFEQSRNAARR